MSEETMLRSGNQLKAARAHVNLTQAEVAERAGVHLNTIALMEKRGDNDLKNPFDIVLRVARALETAGVLFLDGNGHGPGVVLKKPRGEPVAPANVRSPRSPRRSLDRGDLSKKGRRHGDEMIVGFVYVPAASDCVKVGRTKDPVSRLTGLRSELGDDTFLVFMAQCENCDASLVVAIEARAHTILAAYRMDGRYRERFSVSASEAAIAVMKAAQEMECKIDLTRSRLRTRRRQRRKRSQPSLIVRDHNGRRYSRLRGCRYFRLMKKPLTEDHHARR